MPRKLEPLPPPPPSLPDSELPLITTSERFVRIHPLDKDPAFWGRTGWSRFDAPRGEYGVLYAAQGFDGAFIETFGDLTPRSVSVSLLGQRGRANVEPRRELRLVDLAGPGLSRLGLDGRICTGEHDLAQEWSYAIWAHPVQVDGIWYAARHDADQRSVALFEDRSAGAVSVKVLGGLLSESNAIATAQALDKYGFGLLP